MKHRKKRNFYPKQKHVDLRAMDQVLSMMRSMPLTKRIKLACWLMSYTFVAISLLFAVGIISSVSIALFTHYV